MSDDEALEKANKIIAELGGDPESAHGELDDLLCEVLEETHPKLVAAWRSTEKWYA